MKNVNSNSWVSLSLKLIFCWLRLQHVTLVVTEAVGRQLGVPLPHILVPLHQTRNTFPPLLVTNKKCFFGSCSYLAWNSC